MRLHVRIVSLILLVCLWATVARGQALGEAFSTSAVLVSYKPTAQGLISGSGFIVFHESQRGVQVLIPGVEPKTGFYFLVTNKHVIPPVGRRLQVTIRVQTRQSDQTQVRNLTLDIMATDGRYLPSVRLHPSSDVDVAVIDITKVAVEKQIYMGLLSSDLLITKEQLRAAEIRIGDEIYLLGYPDAIFDPRNVSPLLRMGVISTDPREGWAFNEKLRHDYGLPAKLDGFLIDANVFPGSSGSMVVLRPQPSYSYKGGGLRLRTSA